MHALPRLFGQRLLCWYLNALSCLLQSDMYVTTKNA